MVGHFYLTSLVSASFHMSRHPFYSDYQVFDSSQSGFHTEGGAQGFPLPSKSPPPPPPPQSMYNFIWLYGPRWLFLEFWLTSTAYSKMWTGLADSRTHLRKTCRADFYTLVHSHDLRASSPASTPETMHSSTIVNPNNDWMFVGGAQFS